MGFKVGAAPTGGKALDYVRVCAIVRYLIGGHGSAEPGSAGFCLRQPTSGDLCDAIGVTGRAVLLWLVLFGAGASVGSSQEPIGGRRIVRSVSFEGNRAVDDYTLEISIATSQSKTIFARTPWLRWLPFGEKRYLNETELRRDSESYFYTVRTVSSRRRSTP